MKILKLTLIAALSCAFGTPSFAQACGEACTSRFWETAAAEEIETAIQKANVSAKIIGTRQHFTRLQILEPLKT